MDSIQEVPGGFYPSSYKIKTNLFQLQIISLKVKLFF